MAVYFTTTKAQALLDSFDKRINQDDTQGKITTWEKSDDGKYYTHKAKEWTRKAWFKPVVTTDNLRFNLIRPKGENISVSVYGYYHGHLIETFLNHFDSDFSIAEATAKPSNTDNVTGA